VRGAVETPRFSSANETSSQARPLVGGSLERPERKLPGNVVRISKFPMAHSAFWS
jgi:hypothetical protein